MGRYRGTVGRPGPTRTASGRARHDPFGPRAKREGEPGGETGRAASLQMKVPARREKEEERKRGRWRWHRTG